MTTIIISSQYFDKYIKYYNYFKAKINHLSEEEIENLKILKACLEPLAFASKSLTKEIVDIGKAESIISFTINSLTKIENCFAKEIATNLIKRIDERRNKEVVSVLTFFSSNKRCQYFQYLDKEDMSNFIQNFYKHHFKNNSYSESMSSDSEIDGEKSDCDIDEQFSKFTQSSNKRSKNEVNFKDMVLAFEASGSLNPKIKAVVESLSTLQPTSIHNERTFSICGELNRLRRNRMGSDLLNALVILKYIN